MTFSQARVDPRPVKPPAIGLLKSADNVVVGGDSVLTDTPVNDPAEGSVGDDARPIVSSRKDPADWEMTSDGREVHWVRGFSFMPNICDAGDIFEPLGSSIPTPPGLEDIVEVKPYVVEASDKRSTMGSPSDGQFAESQRIARELLLACEQKQIEHELWTGRIFDGSRPTWLWADGDTKGNRHLTSPTVDLIEGDRLVGSETAFAVLERAINDGTCGQQGMIHARADTVSHWVSLQLVHRVGDLLVSELGTIVVPGAGYDGSAPDAGTPGLDPAHANVIPSSDSAWAYATTIVSVRRGAIYPPETIVERLDRGANVLTSRVRRTAASAWGCLHVGIHVDHVNQRTTTGS